MVYIFLADGFEEIEALTPYDMLKRANIDVTLVAVSNNLCVVGSHNISVNAEILIDDLCDKDFDMLILPGGMPGTNNLEGNKKLMSLLSYAYENNKNISAICAAPKILGSLGFLNGKRATCFPGFESFLEGAILEENTVSCDGNIITSRGMGTALDFSLKIIEKLKDKTTADNLSKGILYK